MKELERNVERRERKKRRRNGIVKDIEVKEGKHREAITELLNRIGAEIEVEDVNKIGTKKRRKEMWMVKLKSEKQRKKVMRRKSNLKERRERI